DLPGYGFAKVSRGTARTFQDLGRAYLRGRPNLKRVYLLIDARHGLKAPDAEALDALDKAAVSYQVVLTKADKLKPAEAEAATADTLAEAQPYIQIHDRQTVVIKYGGHAMGEEALARLFAADAVLLKLLGVRPVVVHGGGPQISRMLQRAGVKSTFVDGLRVTDAPTMEVAEMVLSGAINKEIASWITQAGATADVRGVGLSGKDARLITVETATRT